MGKRAFAENMSGEFKRNARDFYATPEKAVLPVLPFLVKETELMEEGPFGWCEPCVGDGALVRALKKGLRAPLSYACDLLPTGDAASYAEARNCLTITEDECRERRIEMFITNPPWMAKSGRGEPTISIIRHLSSLRPSWFLLPADFMHNVYAAPLLSMCTIIKSVGRVRWIEGSPNTGVDNCAWFRFSEEDEPTVPRFYGRGINREVFDGRA